MDKLMENESDGGGGRRMWSGGVRRQMQAEEAAGRSAGTSVSLGGPRCERGRQKSEVFNHAEPQI